MEKLKRYVDRFYKYPILSSLLLSLIGLVMFIFYSLIVSGIGRPQDMLTGIFIGLIISYLFGYPIILTILNTFFLFLRTTDKQKIRAGIKIEVITIVLGFILTPMFINLIDIKFENWDSVLVNNQKHFMLSKEYMAGFVIPVIIAFFSYVFLRIRNIKKTPPLLAVFLISGLYLGIAICVLWIVQVSSINGPDLFVALAAFNFLMILIKVIKEVIIMWDEPIEGAVETELLSENMETSSWSTKFSKLLQNSKNWPLLAFITLLPLLGFVMICLILFGRGPESIYKVWTETADWNLSQKVAPPNEFFDQHYLCTVAAGGHPKIVQPQRLGTRGGRTIIVNRQLCIANAFEQVLEERVPRIHKSIRGFYDAYGYPISRHINSAWSADVVYILMKPLEWIFLIILYLTDVNPESRIAKQYEYKGNSQS